MKIKSSLLSLSCLLFFNSYSQNPETITIKAGETFDHLTNKFYNYPNFINGVVSYKDGNKHEAKLNYNLLLAEVQFIDNTGDTLSIANEKDIKSILIGNDTFIHKDQYFTILAGGSKAKLAASKRFKLADVQKIGAYGLPSISGSITSFRTLFGKSRPVNLVVQEDIIFAKTTSFAIVDMNDRVLPLTKKNIFKLFPASTAEIEEYFDKNNINLSNEQSLISLVNYLASLKDLRY